MTIAETSPPATVAIPARPTPAWRRALSLLLLLLAVVYLGWMIWQQWPLLAPEMRRYSTSDIAIMLALLLFMMFLKSTYHVLALWRTGQPEGQPRTRRLIAAYAGSQIVRYLPGKIIGVAYEANLLAPEVATWRVISATVVQGLLTTALTAAVLFAAAVWLWFDQAAMAVAILLVAQATVFALHRRNGLERMLQQLARRLPRLQSVPTPPQRTRTWHAFLAAVLLLLEWLPYYLCWAWLQPSASGSLQTAILLGSCYAGAALIGNLAILLPSGLFVREAAFLWVGQQFQVEAAVLVAIGLVSRLLFTAADLLFALLASLCNRIAPDPANE